MRQFIGYSVLTEWIYDLLYECHRSNYNVYRHRSHLFHDCLLELGLFLCSAVKISRVARRVRRNIALTNALGCVETEDPQKTF